MNQAIQFDNELVISEGHVGFNAQQQGQVLVCRVSFKTLEQLNKQLNHLDQAVITSNAEAVFESLRFDIEELAEQLIINEQINDEGEVEITV
ncbi:DUF1488 family protein [Shewanella maritima]|uniref:DUF1488 family protein n=1 Tax=Shewanella maritima TaxID=2520507 RepID=UPI003735CB31